MPVIAVDAMGGDFAPAEVVRGVARASLETDIECVLVGDEAAIQGVLETVHYNPEQISIYGASQVIRMDEDPRSAIREKRDASILVAADLVARGHADAVVSAGNTGACVLACAQSFPKIAGIRKAALATVYPRKVGYPGQDPLALLLDVGATVRCEAAELAQFGIMGSAYARRISKVVRPRVGLLNMGIEESKGDRTLTEAYRSLRRLPDADFVGNVEGHDLATGRADVIVCEGFVGNVVLKLVEGLSEVMLDVASEAARRSLAWRLGLLLLSRGIRRLRDLTDYAEYGGAPILGFEKLMIKAHGRSRSRAISNSVKVTAKAVRDGVLQEIASRVAANL